MSPVFLIPSRYLFIFIIRTTCVHSSNRASWFRASFPRVFSTPRGFSPLPLSPWSSQDVSAISSPGCILLCLSSFLRHVNSFSAVFIGLQSSSGTVKSISDMAFDSPLGAASFFTGSLSPTWARLTAAHLNIHHQSSAHQSSDSLLSTNAGFDVCIFYLGLRHQTTHCFIVERHFLLFSPESFFTIFITDVSVEILHGSSATTTKLHLRLQASAHHRVSPFLRSQLSSSSLDFRRHFIYVVSSIYSSHLFMFILIFDHYNVTTCNIFNSHLCILIPNLRLGLGYTLQVYGQPHQNPINNEKGILSFMYFIVSATLLPRS